SEYRAGRGGATTGRGFMKTLTGGGLWGILPLPGPTLIPPVYPVRNSPARGGSSHRFRPEFPRMARRSTLFAVVGLSTGLVTPALADPASNWVYYGPDGKLTYRVDPVFGQLLNFGTVGYQ